MSTPPFAPDSVEAAYDINTAGGRSRLFKKRIDELTRQKSEGGKRLSMDDALFEMRTGHHPDDLVLLEAMGATLNEAQKEKLKTDQFNKALTRMAEENAKSIAPSSELQAAIAATNAARDRQIAFNTRIDELTRKGFSLDQAITQMRANAEDAKLLAAMGAGMTTPLSLHTESFLLGSGAASCCSDTAGCVDEPAGRRAENCVSPSVNFIPH